MASAPALVLAAVAASSAARPRRHSSTSKGTRSHRCDATGWRAAAAAAVADRTIGERSRSTVGPNACATASAASHSRAAASAAGQVDRSGERGGRTWADPGGRAPRRAPRGGGAAGGASTWADSGGRTPPRAPRCAACRAAMMAATAGGGGPEGGRGRGLGRMLEPNGYGLISRMSTWDDVCLRGIPYVRVFTSLPAISLSSSTFSSPLTVLGLAATSANDQSRTMSLRATISRIGLATLCYYIMKQTASARSSVFSFYCSQFGRNHSTL